MELEDFFRDSHHFRSRASVLLYKASKTLPSSPSLLQHSLEELSIALEELRVAEEELHQQNEALLAAQVSLQIEQQHYRELFDFAPDGYLLTDNHGTIREANHAAAKLLNVSLPFLVNKPLITFVDLESRVAFRNALLRLGETNQEQEWESRLCLRDGTFLEVSFKAVVAESYHGQGNPIRWMIRDVTAQKQTERRLQALNEEIVQQAAFEILLRQIGDRLRDILDEREVMQIAVQELVSALNLLGCDGSLYDPHRQDANVCASYFQSPLLPSPPRTVEMQCFSEEYHGLLQGQVLQFCEVIPSGEQGRFAILACPIVDRQEVLGDFWCFCPADQGFSPRQVDLVRGIADRCALALRQARLYQLSQAQAEELQRIHTLKDDFLSTVSHELRTPLTNMKMALHMLKIANTEEKRSRCLQILQSECDREVDLITDLLELQQLEESTYPNFLLEAISLPTWLPTILAPVVERLRERQQPFSTLLPDDIPPLVTDEASLRRVLVELLRNAYKYTPAGGRIILEVRLALEGDQIIFTVKNQATIAAAELPLIFDKFYRVTKNDPWKSGGTGLGLALVKRLVKHLQGEIQVESRDGWTTFSLSLPVRMVIAA